MTSPEHTPSTGPFLAERSFLIQDSTPPLSVTVRMGYPRLRQDAVNWECEVHVREPDRTRVMYPNGADAFQAIQFGLVLIGVELKHINEQLNGALRWGAEDSAEIGFPTYPDFAITLTP